MRHRHFVKRVACLFLVALVTGMAGTVRAQPVRYYDVWRNSTNDLNTATMIGHSLTADNWTDNEASLDPCEEWFYWVRSALYETVESEAAYCLVGTDDAPLVSAYVKLWAPTEAMLDSVHGMVPIVWEVYLWNGLDSNEWTGDLEVIIYEEQAGADDVYYTFPIDSLTVSPTGASFDLVATGAKAFHLWFYGVEILDPLEVYAEIRVVGGTNDSNSTPAVDVGVLIPVVGEEPNIAVHAQQSGALHPSTVNWTHVAGNTDFSNAESPPAIEIVEPNQSSTVVEESIYVVANLRDTEGLTAGLVWNETVDGCSGWSAVNPTLSGIQLSNENLGEIDLVYGENTIGVTVEDAQLNDRTIFFNITRQAYVDFTGSSMVYLNDEFEYLELTWVNPTDARFDGVRVVRRMDRFAVTENDGDIVYEGDLESCGDANVCAASTYYYAVFPFQEETCDSQTAQFFYSVADQDAQLMVTVPGLLGDLNFDEEINLLDFSRLKRPWFSSNCLVSNFCDCADLNGDGIVDETDLRLFLVNWSKMSDCNGNGIVDSNDIDSGFSGDCNSNYVPDECDIASGVSQDSNGNGIPDECEAPVPPGMAFIPGGTFQMGDSFAPEGDTYELPVHTVTLDSFYMSRYETTNQQYCDYLNSAYPGQIKVVGGVVYAFDDTGNAEPYCNTSSAPVNYPDYGNITHIDFSGGTFSVLAKGGRDMANDPVLVVSWYGAVAYCNWRSEQEGKDQCYDLSTWTCDLSKHGYRLATEAEWEYAARGGLADRRFPWGDTINHDNANYRANGSVDTFDTSPYTSYTFHPSWNDGIWPYTSVAGSFAANGYGVYDMAGTVWEWCNDWFSSTYYSSSPASNPPGPASGSSRVLRGGGWFSGATRCRVAIRYLYAPAFRGISIGFRSVLDFQ